jgi:transcription-repair coupling factor (superfamily II helicase)
LDIPNVNTIIINRADRFGMAELHQLRGRVGRSNLEAYAYLLIPPIDQLSKEAMFRLQAIEQFSELGSGLNLAMRDLEIRGAGNLLGGEQSGFIDAMGFEMYNRVLQEAVRELKEQEFQQMLPEVSRLSRCDTVVEVDVEALLPGMYVESDAERLTIYRRLYSVSSVEQLAEIVHELEDRFGRLPVPVRNLIEVVKIRLAAARLGVTQVAIARGTVEIHFPPEAEAGFYESEEFREMMMRISVMKESNVVMKQSGGNLRLLASLGNMPGSAELLAEAARLLSCMISGPEGLPDDRRANSPG